MKVVVYFVFIVFRDRQNPGVAAFRMPDPLPHQRTFRYRFHPLADFHRMLGNTYNIPPGKNKLTFEVYRFRVSIIHTGFM